MSKIVSTFSTAIFGFFSEMLSRCHQILIYLLRPKIGLLCIFIFVSVKDIVYFLRPKIGLLKLCIFIMLWHRLGNFRKKSKNDVENVITILLIIFKKIEEEK